MNHEKIEDAMGNMSERADNVVARVAMFAAGFVAHTFVYGWAPILALGLTVFIFRHKTDAEVDHAVLCTLALLLVMLWIDVKWMEKR